VTFTVTKNDDGRYSIIRLAGERSEPIEDWETQDEARLAAERYADQARLAGLQAEVVIRE
jgi:hypothetical protein